MSLYNNLLGFSPCCIMILPMLGKHPNEYPRFRDCYLFDENHPQYDGHIHVFTRVGGSNRGCGYGEEELKKHENYVTSIDDSFDPTYASYIFSVPDKWKADFEKIMSDQLDQVSNEYQEQVCKVYPKLAEEIKNIFSQAPATK